MSVGLVFAATDGVLVVADGREVVVGGGALGPSWVSDSAVKVVASADGAPLITVGVGLVAVHESGVKHEVLDILEGISASPRPEFGMAAGEGPWTVQALTNQAANTIEDDAGSFVDHRVLALAVGWPAGAPEPELWRLSVGSLDPEGIETFPDEDDPPPSDGKEWVTFSAGASQVHSFPSAGFYGVPDGRQSDRITFRSQVIQLVHDSVDRTTELMADSKVANTDDAWLSTYRFAGLDTATVRLEVESKLRQR